MIWEIVEVYLHKSDSLMTLNFELGRSVCLTVVQTKFSIQEDHLSVLFQC